MPHAHAHALRAKDYVISANSHLNASHIKAALADYQKAINLEPENSHLHQLIATAYIENKDYTAAIASYSQALAHAPTEQHTNIRRYRGGAYHMNGELAEALAEYDALEQKGFDDMRAYCAVGDTYQKNRQYEEAIAAYQKAIAIAPQDPAIAGVYNNCAHSYKRLGRLDEALSFFSKAIEVDPSYTLAHVNRGHLHFKQQRYADAMNAYLQAFKIPAKDGYDTKTWKTTFSNTLSMLGQKDDASIFSKSNREDVKTSIKQLRGYNYQFMADILQGTVDDNSSLQQVIAGLKNSKSLFVSPCPAANVQESFGIGAHYELTCLSLSHTKNPLRNS